ncbi:ABC transporter ATP-binding protein [Pseudogemmobacter humi]|uniref:Polysialic acid transport ATP-binding protein KpsT n=1 Tax=Pseudogemmobacter humi TaxID=2483812 RepID=A0A3P5XEM2_9RHOB|nr:ABC transporter ATP-binding protein [Pseudogemmobacter humi]VDC33188.1 Polysialic acid transport ATP-binding protein KpsT [Pseudogemmobacter humi]
MIRLVNLTKTFHLEGVSKTVLKDCNVTFESGRSYGLLGRNGAGKSTLLRMIAGTQDPTSGRIEISGTVSWPVGFAGSFHPDLSGAQNARYVARIYGVDSDELVAFAEEFADLGSHFHLPVRTYSSGMISRLAFGLSMGIDFDTYLVDEVTAVGDEGFRQKSNRIFLSRMRRAGAIVVNHSPQVIQELCDVAMVLHDGELRQFEDVVEGLRYHQRIIFGT